MGQATEQIGYWEKRWKGYRTGTARVGIEWDGGSAVAVLYDEGVPRTTAAVLEQLPLRVPYIHVAWSGDMVMSRDPIDIGVPEQENDVRLPQPGDLGWDPKFKELSFTYDVAECYGPTGPWTISIYGQIVEGLEEFAAFARSTRYEGVKEIGIYELTRGA